MSTSSPDLPAQRIGNRSRRMVLIFDNRHPLLTALEREPATQTVEGLVDYHDGAGELGEL
jgi:hypothetical protein